MCIVLLIIMRHSDSHLWCLLFVFFLVIASFHFLLFKKMSLFFIQFLLFHLSLHIRLVLDLSSIKTGNSIIFLFTLGQDTVGF
jgi:hypothetical protein